jgi:hypothetical protein
MCVLQTRVSLGKHCPLDRDDRRYDAHHCGIYGEHDPYTALPDPSPFSPLFSKHLCHANHLFINWYFGTSTPLRSMLFLAEFNASGHLGRHLLSMSTPARQLEYFYRSSVLQPTRSAIPSLPNLSQVERNQHRAAQSLVLSQSCDLLREFSPASTVGIPMVGHVWLPPSDASTSPGDRVVG